MPNICSQLLTSVASTVVEKWAFAKLTSYRTNDLSPPSAANKKSKEAGGGGRETSEPAIFVVIVVV